MGRGSQPGAWDGFKQCYKVHLELPGDAMVDLGLVYVQCCVSLKCYYRFTVVSG